MVDKDAPFKIHRVDKYTGELQDDGVEATTVMAAVRFFVNSGFPLDPVMLNYTVVSAGGYRWFDGEVFLEEHPVQTVLAAWTAGARLARESRQRQLRELWPVLAMALDNLEINGAKD